MNFPLSIDKTRSEALAAEEGPACASGAMDELETERAFVLSSLGAAVDSAAMMSSSIKGETSVWYKSMVHHAQNGVFG